MKIILKNYWRYILTIVLLLLFFSIYMIVFTQQPLFCNCTWYNFWNGFSAESGNSQRFLDWYTFSHILSGMLLIAIAMTFIKKRYIAMTIMSIVVLATIWEIIEATEYVIFHFRTATISRDYIGDSILNAVSDILAILLGMIIATKMRLRFIILIFVIVEITSLYFIHDNLTLNTLSFIIPNNIMNTLFPWY